MQRNFPIPATGNPSPANPRHAASKVREERHKEEIKQQEEMVDKLDPTATEMDKIMLKTAPSKSSLEKKKDKDHLGGAGGEDR